MQNMLVCVMRQAQQNIIIRGIAATASLRELSSVRRWLQGAVALHPSKPRNRSG